MTDEWVLTDAGRAELSSPEKLIVQGRAALCRGTFVMGSRTTMASAVSVRVGGPPGRGVLSARMLAAANIDRADASS